MADSFTELHEAQLGADRFMILHLKAEMQTVGYEFTYWTKASIKKTVRGTNGAPGTLKDIIDKKALQEKRWKRKFMRWGTEMYKRSANVHKCLRLRQNGYNEKFHRMKRPQDFEEEEELTLTQQGVPDPFSDEESEAESDSSYHGNWAKA